MNSDLRLLAGLAMTIVAVGLGVAVRLGLWRGFEGRYRDPDLPRALRNSPFAFIPMGIAIGSIVAADAMSTTLRTLAFVLVVSAPIWALLAFAISHRPPRIFKPRWLQEEEAIDRPANPSKGWFDVVVFIGTIGAATITIFAMLFLLVRQG